MQAKSQFSKESFKAAPVVGILRGNDIDTINWVTHIYESCGFSTLEITMNTPNFSTIVAGLIRDFPNLNIGAGTVCDKQELQTALDAGAAFIVTPNLDEEVINLCVKDDVPIFPGAYTPSEVYRAWSLGATAVKLFPATQLGVQFIRDIKGPFPQIKLLPTGGVSKDNIKDFFDAGVVGVGMGSSLFPKEILQSKDLDLLTEHLSDIKRKVLP